MRRELEVNGIEDSSSTGDVFLTRLPDGQYALRVLGRCGEGLPGVPVDLRLEHAAWVPSQTFSLITDSHGTCALGPLQSIRSISAYAALPLSLVFLVFSLFSSPWFVLFFPFSWFLFPFFLETTSSADDLEHAMTAIQPPG